MSLRAVFNDENISVMEITSGWRYKKYKIDKNGQVGNYNSMVPDKYQQVEYIESTGTQYIDTGLLAKNYSDIICEIKGSYTKIAPSKTIFGAGGGNSNTWYLIGILYGTSIFGAPKGTGGTEKNSVMQT